MHKFNIVEYYCKNSGRNVRTSPKTVTENKPKLDTEQKEHPTQVRNNRSANNKTYHIFNTQIYAYNNPAFRNLGVKKINYYYENVKSC